jgi:hypothetical protein
MRQENEKTRSGEYDLSLEELWEKKFGKQFVNYS